MCEVSEWRLPGVFFTLLGDSLLFVKELRIFGGGKWSESESCSAMSDSLRPHGLYCPWNSPGQNTGAGSLSLLQGTFPTQGLNPGLPHCRRILYQLSYQGSPVGGNQYPLTVWGGFLSSGLISLCERHRLCPPFISNLVILVLVNNIETIWSWE